MAGPPPPQNPLAGLLGGPQSPQQQGLSTPLLDALITRGLAEIAGTPAATSATPLEGYPQLPNPDPNSSPPLYGEPPGLGWLYAREPEFRQAALVTTNPEIVREMLLRAIEVVSQNAQLPFNEEGAAKNAEAILKMSQAYLLLDPEVDAEGVSPLDKATAQAAGAIATQSAAPQPAGTGNSKTKKAETVGRHVSPPTVTGGAAAQALQNLHGNALEIMRGARGSNPKPNRNL